MAIAKQDFEQLMNQARVKLPGASEGGLKGEFFDTLDEFVSDSNCWMEWIPLTIQPGTLEYTVQPTTGGQIFRLVFIYDQNFIGYPAILEHFRPPGAVIRLVWPQNTTLAVKVVVVKKITLPTTTENIPDAPDWLLPTYHRAILDGLLGRMMGQQAKSYSNDKLSTYHLKRFRDGIAMAKVATMRSNLFGGQAWRFPRNFRTNSQRGGVSTPFPSSTGWG